MIQREAWYREADEADLRRLVVRISRQYYDTDESPETLLQQLDVLARRRGLTSPQIQALFPADFPIYLKVDRGHFEQCLSRAWREDFSDWAPPFDFEGMDMVSYEAKRGLDTDHIAFSPREDTSGDLEAKVDLKVRGFVPLEGYYDDFEKLDDALSEGHQEAELLFEAAITGQVGRQWVEDSHIYDYEPSSGGEHGWIFTGQFTHTVTVDIDATMDVDTLPLVIGAEYEEENF